jgi:hypothetical protein
VHNSFFKKYFILAYNSCTGDHCGICICAYVVLPLPPPPFLEQCQQFHSSLFIRGYKIHPPCSPSSPFPCPHPRPAGATPRKDLLFPPVLPSVFKKCILIVQRGFVALQVCACHASIRLTPTPHSFSTTTSPLGHPPTVPCSAFRSSRDGRLQCLSFSAIFFPSPASCSPPDRLTNTILFSLHVDVCV